MRGPLSAPPGSIPERIGPYRVVERLAVGGMAEVYRALQVQSAGDDRAVVIKRMLPSLVRDEGCRAMFDEEGRLGLLIDHPNVVEVIDRGVDGDSPYIALEYVFGVDLWRLGRHLARHQKLLDVPLALHLATEMLAGLDAVHAVRDARGNPLLAVHRDVSPSNVFLSVHGDVKLGDLGIARPLVRDHRRPIAPFASRGKGKLGYLAPEQIMGADVDQRADVFAAAVVAAELLLGRPLFTGATELAVLLAIRDGDLSVLEQRAAGMPPGLVSALRDALARDREQRVKSASDLKHRLAPYVVGAPQRLKHELGALVTEVLDAGPSVDRRSLARTVETGAEEQVEAVLSGRLSHDEILELFTPAGVLRTPTPVPDKGTPGLDLGPFYEVDAGGKRYGPWPYARVIRALVMGEIAPSDMVRKGQGESKPLGQHPELARHLPPSSRTPTFDDRRSGTDDRGRMAETSESFSLAIGFGLLDVLSRMFLERDTGLVLCERGTVRKEVYVQNGKPVFVTSNQPEELLGEYLVRADVIDRAELDLALAVMPRFEGRLGDTLAALGLVEPVHLVRHIERKVREQLLEAVTWTEGRAALYRNASPPESSFTLALDAFELLEAGAAARVAAGLDRAFLESAAVAVVRTEGASMLPGAPAHLEEILVAVRAPRALAEVEGLSPDPGRARAAVLLLASLGAVRALR